MMSAFRVAVVLVAAVAVSTCQAEKQVDTDGQSPTTEAGPPAELFAAFAALDAMLTAEVKE